MAPFLVFIRKLSLVVLFLVTVSAAILFLIPPGENNFWRESIQEKNKLFEVIPAPRIVIAGGSSTALGIDSEEIGRQTGARVINEGIHAGMSVKLLLQMVERHLEAGDIVILPLEYDLYYLDLNGETRSMAGIVEIMPSIIPDLYFSHPDQLPEILTALIQMKLERKLESLIHSESSGIYSEERLFNQYGDYTSHLGKTYSTPIPDRALIPEGEKINPRVIEELNSFYQAALDRQAQVFIAFPPARMTNCQTTSPARFDGFYTDLAGKLKMPILLRPEQSCYADEHFYDSEYHLNAAGRQINTERFIKMIQAIPAP